MKAAQILLVGGKAAEAQLLQKTLDATGVRILTMADAASALAKMDELLPDLVLIGSGIPRDHAQWTLERMMASATLRGIPVVLVFYESSRAWVLEMIKLGLRAYIQLPREREDLRRRLAQHLPAGIFSDQNKNRQPQLRESVGERLRQRMAKKQVENAVSESGSKSGVDLKKPIPLLEQQYAEDCGLTVRISSREISLFEKSTTTCFDSAVATRMSSGFSLVCSLMGKSAWLSGTNPSGFHLSRLRIRKRGKLRSS